MSFERERCTLILSSQMAMDYTAYSIRNKDPYMVNVSLAIHPCHLS